MTSSRPVTWTVGSDMAKDKRESLRVGTTRRLCGITPRERGVGGERVSERASERERGREGERRRVKQTRGVWTRAFIIQLRGTKRHKIKVNEGGISLIRNAAVFGWSGRSPAPG